MPRLSKIGAAALAAFGWTSGSAVSASYLVVAGGGGSAGYNGGGAGAGGLLTGTTSLNPTLSYTITVGAGGTAGNNAAGSRGTNGADSVFSAFTSVGGGTSGSASGTLGVVNGSTGGSGGGAGGATGTNATVASGTSGQGNAGGDNFNSGSYGAGGGGGASAVGGNGTTSVSGNGGAGTASSISGTSVTYAGGGGGGSTVDGATRGTGGSGGGGDGGASGNPGVAGTANTGGGAGGGAHTQNGANGGSGIVIISYVGAQQFSGGVVTSSGGNTIHTFTTSGTLGPVTPLSANYLVVAGGGGSGGADGGGGGAGGLLSGSGITIDPYSNYLVTVGAGGAAGATSASTGANGGNSAFSMVTTTAIGGGGATGYGVGNGIAGGSGGGAGGGSTYTGGAGTSGQGNAGGATYGASSPYSGGGGGGSGGAGQAGIVTAGGNGGIATASSISGTSTYYAGGGGGGAAYASGTTTPGLGGGTATTAQKGGGGNGNVDPFAGGANSGNGVAGTANTGGGGGGGSGSGATNLGGAGGSGVVIISYAGATQLMAGGVVTIAGGNVIHTFNSSGYLTPLTLFTRSLRFRSSASAYLNKTFGSAPTSRTTMTMSMWFKVGALSNAYNAFFIQGTANNWESILLVSPNNTNGWVGNSLRIAGPGGSENIRTNQLFRDPAAWYHMVVVYDTTNATASDRVRLFINGSRVTSFAASANPSQNQQTTEWLVSSFTSNIGTSGGSTTQTFDGYMAEVNVIDGQALAPTAFGTVNSYGVWQPITYGGSYGTNGFRLPFTNNASTTTLGYDFSPQGNNWTTNNISVTAGATYDSMTDVPTLTSATAANYATLNPLQLSASGSPVTSNGNLRLSSSASGYPQAGCTFGTAINGFKGYFEVTLTGGNDIQVGFNYASAAITNTDYTSTGCIYVNSTGNLYNNNSTVVQSSYITAPSTGGVIMVAFDFTGSNKNIWWGYNGTWGNRGGVGVPSTGTNPGITVTEMTSVNTRLYLTTGGGASTPDYNFGQRPFNYSPPSGYVALNTFNL